jgi:hypothetical protein
MGGGPQPPPGGKWVPVGIIFGSGKVRWFDASTGEDLPSGSAPSSPEQPPTPSGEQGEPPSEPTSQPK